MTQTETIAQSLTHTANPTLYAAVVKLIANEGGSLPATQGKLAHGAFLHIIEAVDSQLSTALHQPNQRRPFTVSPLHDLGRARGGRVRVHPGQEVWLRFTLLDQDLFATLTRYFLQPGLLDFQWSSLQLGQLTFTVSELLVTPGSHPWAGYTHWSDLLKRWQHGPLDQHSHEVKIRFASPTVFNYSNKDRPELGKLMETFPTPDIFFSSLAARWNAFMPPAGALDQAAIKAYAKETVVVGLYEMKSRMVRYLRQPQIGAMGRVTYLLKDRTDPYLIRTLNLLADYAFYSGVGYKTTMGMGQVRRE